MTQIHSRKLLAARVHTSKTAPATQTIKYIYRVQLETYHDKNRISLYIRVLAMEATSHIRTE